LIREACAMKLSTRLAIAMVALALMTATAVGLLTYSKVAELALPGALDRLRTHALAVATDLQASVRGARADVLGFRASNAVFDIMMARLNRATDPTAAATEMEWRRRLGSRLAAELNSKPNYHEFSVVGVDDGGRELVRVERSGADRRVRIVPEAELQRQGERYYFKETIRLADGQVYVSPIDLHRQNGIIDVPHIPVLRVATPVPTPSGQPFAIIIIDVDMRADFARIRSTQLAGGQVYVVNERGDYLMHPDPARELGFELGISHRVQDDLPALAGLLGSDNIAPRVVEDRTGARLGLGLVTTVLAGGTPVTVIEAMPYTELMSAATSARDATLLGGLAAVIGAIALAVIIARSLTRPLVQMTRAVEGFAHNEPVAVPTGGGREIAVLASTFTRMASEARERTAALSREIEERRRIVDTSLDAFVQLDETGHVRDWNRQAEAIFGWSRAEAMGQPVTSLYLPQGYRPRYLDLAERLKQSDTDEMVGERFEFEAVRKDRKRIKMELSITSLRRRNGIAFNLFLRDLTQKIATEEQLRHAQKMESVGQLTGGIAHDFNNMLTVITGTIDILAEAVADKPQLAAIAKLISEAADRGAELTAHLLAFARKQPLQPREIDVNILLVESAKLMWPTLGEQIEIEPMLADDVWPALVDPNQLTSALLNLAINARDAMPNGGKLMLETKNVVLDQSFAKMSSDAKPGSYVMIAVSDTGSGIPEAIRERVFEPFFSTKGVGKGSGLGLSMVYGFVKQSGGHIRLYSEEGHGTTVKLYLPRASKVSGQVEEASPASRIEGGDETILVVEDDALVRTYVDAQLRSLGYRTLTAANATEALATADSGAAFDLLFTDVIMPGPLNGRQLAEEMSKRRSPLKVLFTSGYAENAMIHQGRLDPGVLLLTKPYRKLDLAQMVRLALGAAGTYARRDVRNARAG
jgi:PAS domain S-box-containing protein